MLAFLFGDSMDIRTAAHYMSVGYRVRRVAWSKKNWISERSMRQHPTSFMNYDLLADDWEIITDDVVSYFPIQYADEVV